MNTTREIAGLSAACKAARKGFDSLPRLHKSGWWFTAGEKVGRWILTSQRRSFLAGIQYAAFKHERKRWVHQKTERQASGYRLMFRKHESMIQALTALHNLREKHIAMSKELSALKRAK